MPLSEKWESQWQCTPPAGRAQLILCATENLIRCGCMKSKLSKNRVVLQPFESGQVWQMEGSDLEIGLIGKTLVHFKHYKADMKRSRVSLLNKDALERFLQDNQAVLVRRRRLMTAS